MAVLMRFTSSQERFSSNTPTRGKPPSWRPVPSKGFMCFMAVMVKMKLTMRADVAPKAKRRTDFRHGASSARGLLDFEDNMADW